MTSFLAGVESGDQCLFNSEVLSCVSGVMLSIKIVFSMLGYTPKPWVTDLAIDCQ